MCQREYIFHYGKIKKKYIKRHWIHNIVKQAWLSECPSVSRITAICQEFMNLIDSFGRQEVSERHESENRIQSVNAIKDMLEVNKSISIKKKI